MSQADLDERTQVHSITGDGDHERFAHIVVPASAVTEAYITGNSVTALCGKRWVPTRDPGQYPVCPTCKDVLEQAKAFGSSGGSAGGSGGGSAGDGGGDDG